MAVPRRKLTVFDRSIIEVRLRDGWGIRAIARELGRSPGMVSDDLWGFFVAARSRREGIGDALLGLAIDAAQPLVEQLMLAVVANSAAIRPHQRHGFVTNGVEVGAVKTASSYQDEVLMSRRMTVGHAPVSVGNSSDR